MRAASLVGLLPEQFWSLTPRELGVYSLSYSERYDLFMSQLAHFFAQTMNVHLKRKVKGKDLYNVKRRAKNTGLTNEDRRKMFHEAVKAMGPERYPIFKPTPKRKGGDYLWSEKL